MLHKFQLKLHSEREYFIILILALVIYIPAIGWGLPGASHPLGVHSWDVDGVTGLQTLSELHNLVFSPKEDWWVAYPLFHYFVIAICYVPYLGYLYLTGGLSQPTDTYPFGFTAPVSTFINLTLIGRAITVLMAGLLVANTYLTARTIWDKFTARIAALAVSLPTPIVYYSRTGNLDIPVLFWMSLAILMMARILKFGFTARRAVWTGIFSAIAVSTKDQAYAPLLIGLVSLIIIHLSKNDESIQKANRWKSPLILIVSGAISFFITSGILFAPNRFFRHILFVINYKKTFWNAANLEIVYPQNLTGYTSLSYDVMESLFMAIGPVLIIVGITGLVVSWRSELFNKILFGMLIAHILFVIFPLLHMQYRYILLPVYIFAFYIARAVVIAFERENRFGILALMAFIIGIGWVGLRTIDLTYQMLFDARYAVSQWLKQKGNAEDKVAFVSLTQISHLPQGMSAISLIKESNKLDILQSKQARFVLLQPDFSSRADDRRSRYFPENIYRQIESGELGYEKKETFETPPLFNGFLLELPLIHLNIVNPKVTIYELKEH